MSSNLAIFLTYSSLPHFGVQDYEGWLRRHDNPFFNSIPGIGRYENWKLVAPYPAELGFDYFDLIYLDGTRELEALWFDSDLTRFRRNWVSLWGYGGAPSEVNGQGYLLEGPGMPPLSASGGACIGFADPGAPIREGVAWNIAACMPKHYAFPLDEAPVPWIREDPEAVPLPGRQIILGAGAADAERQFLAERIAPGGGSLLDAPAGAGEAASAQAVELVRNFLQCFRERDYDRANEFLAPGCVMEYPGPVRVTDCRDVPKRGARFYRRVTKTIERFDAMPEDDCVVVYCLGTLSGEWADGSPLKDVRFIDRFVIRNDAIEDHKVWNDLAVATPSVPGHEPSPP